MKGVRAGEGRGGDVFETIATLLLGRRMDPPPELAPEAVPERVILRRGKLVPWLGGVLSRMTGPASAVTLGRTIVINPEARLTPTLLAHELAHVRQWERDSLFPIRYSLANIRHGYHDNPYEVEARQVAAAESATLKGEGRA
jgi:hypothetical protein